MKREPSEKAYPTKSGRKTDPLTPEELREMYRMVKELHHHLGLDGTRVISLRESKEQVDKDVLKWRERQAKKKEREGKKE